MRAVELTGGGPFDGDRIVVLDSVRVIVLQRWEPSVFLHPLGPVPGPGGPDDGCVLLGKYEAQDEPFTEFRWIPEE